MNIPTGQELSARDVNKRVQTLGGKDVYVDREGFLWHPEDWTDAVAESIAADMGIEKMNDVQWRVVRFLREYRFYHGRAPLNRDIKAGLGMSLMELECVFPNGIKQGARRVAGLPNPRTCAG
jgi:dissimilatory sulfite reductase related protein